MLCPEAKEELNTIGIIELVSVTVTAVPDPERPEDRYAMKILAEVCDNFKQGIPEIDRDLDAVDQMCSTSENDLMPTTRDELLVLIGQRVHDIAELQEGRVGGQPVPYLSNPAIAELIKHDLENPDQHILVWCVGWSATKEDDGTILVYEDDPMIPEFVDEYSWSRIRDRMRRANFVIGGLMAGLLEEG